MLRGGGLLYAARMSDLILHTASKMLPLGILFGAIFGALLLLALFLHWRIARDRTQSAAGRSTALAGPGDVLAVLGRMYTLQEAWDFSLGATASRWFRLQSDTEEGRTAVATDLSQAIHFPGRQAALPAETYPERLERPEGLFERLGPIQEPGQGLRLACYRGPEGRFLIQEELRGTICLWRGKAIPTEGLKLLD